MTLCFQITAILLGLSLAYSNELSVLLEPLPLVSDRIQQQLMAEPLGSLAHSLQQDVSVLANDDADCLEDRLEAVEIGRQCSRRCKKDVPCENARKQCLCDGLCGMSCLKPDLHCVELPKIEHGDYQPKTTRFNTKVTYQCEPGFYLFGSRERLCQGDEDWSGTPAECLPERKYLPESISPTRHVIDQSSRTLKLTD